MTQFPGTRWPTCAFRHPDLSLLPDRDTRTKITSRKKDADVPELIDTMGVHRAFVWLPIWNTHEEFWKHKGHPVAWNTSGQQYRETTEAHRYLLEGLIE